MKRGISTVEVVTGLVFTLFAVAAIATLSYGYSFADALFIQPAVTRTIAQKAIDDMDPGWTLTDDTAASGTNIHRYTFQKDDMQRNVHLFHNHQTGEWIVGRKNESGKFLEGITPARPVEERYEP